MTSPHQHAFALTALIAVVGIFALSFVNQPQVTGEVIQKSPPADIGIEHTAPLSLSIDASELKGRGLIIFTANSEEETVISVPENWKRKEVRGAKIGDITSESASFGFTSWHFPPSASVTFEMPLFPSSVILHNPSSIPIKINLTKVDLNTEEVEKDVMLIQEAPIKLW